MQRRIREIDLGDWIGNPKTKVTDRQRARSMLEEILTESFEEVETTAVASGLFEPGHRRNRCSTKDLERLSDLNVKPSYG